MILKNGKRIDGCSDTVPIGTLNPYVGSTAPYGYLLCQGQKVSKITYPELYAICGNTFGPETSTEFTLPDLRGQTIAGYKEGDSTFGTLGGLIGSLTHTHEYGLAYCGAYRDTVIERDSNAGILNYNSDDTFTLNNGSSATIGQYAVEVNGGYVASSQASSSNLTHYMATGNVSYTSTVQPTIILNWVVKAFMLMPNQSYVATTEQESDTNTYSCNYINDKFNQGGLIGETKLTQNASELALTNLHLQPGNTYKIIIAEYCPTSTGSGHCLIIDDAITGYIGMHSYVGTNYTTRQDISHTNCLAWVNGWGVGTPLCFTEVTLQFFNKDWIGAQGRMVTSAGDASWTLDVMSTGSYNGHNMTEINTLKVKPRDATQIGTGSYIKIYKI